MQKHGWHRNIWIIAAFIPIFCIMVASVRWSFDHPYGTSWDEAIYINQALVDAQCLDHGMLHRLGGRILLGSWGRPPAYRVLALPFLVLFGSHTASMRLLSLVCYGLSCLLVYLATRRITSRPAAALAVLVFALSPEVVSACMWFSTEGPLYLATAAMLYFVLASWTTEREHPLNWIGLGLAVGIGFLSKASFLAIAPPLLVFWFVAHRWGRVNIPSLLSQGKAALLAVIVAGPWWFLNIRSIVTSTESARAFVANSLGRPSLGTWLHWLDTVFQSLLGHGLGILIVLLLIVCFWRAFVKKQRLLDPLQRAALGACAAAGVPIVIAQLSGTNDLLRHISPAVIPLAIAVGVLAEKTGWVRSKAAVAVSGGLFCVQCGMILAPALVPNTHPVDFGFVNGRLPWTVMIRRDQWDWKPLFNIARSLGLSSPKISFLGFGPTFTPPNIEYPWYVEAASASPPLPGPPHVSWLWRYEQGPLNWHKVMAAANESDLVVTAPHYRGVSKQQILDNQHNAEFAARLSHDLSFQAPVDLEMGRFKPVEVVVYVRKSVAKPGQPQSTGAQTTTH